MKYFDNFLTSSHSFSKNDNLEKFRFSLLNIFMVMANVFVIMHILASSLHLLPFDFLFVLSLVGFACISILAQYSLRKNRSLYVWVVYVFLVGSAALFYFVLFTHPEDEFRLVSFFLLLFITYVLLGKNYGISVAIIIFVSILLISKNYDLNISSYAYATFFTFFIIFSIFLYFFLHKVEKDAIEFKILNHKLKEKVSEEVNQRQEQEQMLLQQCRLASMGEMIDSIAHQWRQPLMNINAILMNMERGLETKEHPKEYLENKMDEVINLTTHMSQTIEDFRTLLKADKEKTYFDIEKSIHHVLELFEGSLKDVEVLNSNEQTLLFYGYENELIQVIIILLSNAIEILKTRNVVPKQIDIHVKLSSKLTIIIEDNAGGIKKEHLDTVFDPYFTTKEATGGTGLGLYIAKIIIEQNMQGTLTVTNTDKGAKFIISLPKK